MRHALSLTLALGLAAVAAADDRDGFKPLFNGKDLAGWSATAKAEKDGTRPDAKGTWSVVGGELHCTGQPLGYLATDAEYGDYVLRLEWRFPKGSKGGNSGVLVHLQKSDKWWPTSVEAQLRSGRAGDIWLMNPPEATLEVDPARRDAADKTGRHVWRIGKDDPVEKPFGEWNRMEVTCKGGDIVIAVNGRTVNEGKRGNLTRGRIALQSEGAEIHFRDVAIKSLK